jgi:hypothetical protein
MPRLDEHGLSKRIKGLSLILCGPILRRTEPNAVTVWVAMKAPRTVILRVYSNPSFRGKLQGRAHPGFQESVEDGVEARRMP